MSKTKWNWMEEKEENFIMMMDGTQHTKREVTDCCYRESSCKKCGKPMHFQGIYGGYIERCESRLNECENGGVIDYE